MALDDGWSRLFAAAVAAMFVVGVVARVVVWLSPYGVPEADEAVGGLMARHLLDGEVPAYYWGQGYGGPLETWLAAPLLAAFGNTWVGLRLVPIALTALTSVVIWRIGSRTVGRYGAVTAAAAAWVFPSYAIWKSIHFHIFYASGMLLGALAILLVLRLREAPSRRDAVLLGLVAGIGLWQSGQLVTIIPAAVAWLLFRRPSVVRLVPAALPGFLVGVVPVVLSNVRHSWWTLDIGQIGIVSTYRSRVGNFFTNTLPMALDLRAPCTLHWYIWKPAALLVYGVLIAGFVLLAYKSRRTNRELLVLVIVLFPFIYAVNQLTGTFTHPGYVLMLVPVLVLAVCSWVVSPRQGIWAMAAVVLLVAGSFLDLHTNAIGGRPVPGCLGTGSYMQRDFGPLIASLDRLGIERLYASYWVAYRITYESGERIIAAEARPNALRVSEDGVVIPRPNDEALRPRRPEYNEIVSRVPAPAWVIHDTLELGLVDYAVFEEARYESVGVGEFTIYYRNPAADSGAPSP